MKRLLHLAALATSAVLTVATSAPRWTAEDEVEVGVVRLDAESPVRGVEVTVRYEGPETPGTIEVRFDGDHEALSSAALVLYGLDEPFDGELGPDAVELVRSVIPGGFADEPAEVVVGLPTDFDAAPRQDLHFALALEGDGPLEGVLSVRASVTTFEDPGEPFELRLEAE